MTKMSKSFSDKVEVCLHQRLADEKYLHSFLTHLMKNN